MGQSLGDLRAHFGLGTEAKAEVTVRWPSGAVEPLGALEADRIYRVVEGAGVAR